MPWTPLVLWALASSQFFHATGHLPTFSSIQWGAAFVGFPGGHSGTLLPATLVALNTFSSHILFAGICLSESVSVALYILMNALIVCCTSWHLMFALIVCRKNNNKKYLVV